MVFKGSDYEKVMLKWIVASKRDLEETKLGIVYYEQLQLKAHIEAFLTFI